MGTKYHRCPPDEMELRAPRYDSTRAVGEVVPGPHSPESESETIVIAPLPVPICEPLDFPSAGTIPKWRL